MEQLTQDLIISWKEFNYVLLFILGKFQHGRLNNSVTETITAVTPENSQKTEMS